MCSKFENKETGFSILEKLDKDELGNYILEDDGDLKKEVFAPTNFVFSLIKSEKDFKLKNFLWGIQFDKEKKSPLIFNSRIETIKEKSYWTRLFYKNRCLLPATAFFEWKEINKKKIPHRISLPGEDFFFIPSIFVKMEDFYYASMITTGSNAFMKNVHNRMPVILDKKDGIDFLNAEPITALKMCKSLSEEIEMKCDMTTFKK
jgi:putative SOS response-associated peptidase YedK